MKEELVKRFVELGNLEGFEFCKASKLPFYGMAVELPEERPEFWNEILKKKSKFVST